MAFFGCCRAEVAKDKEAEAAADGISKDVSDKPLQQAVMSPATPAGAHAEKKEEKAVSEEDAAKAKAKQLAKQVDLKTKEGDKAFSKNDWDAAIAAYGAAIELDAKHVSAWTGRGGAYLRKGDHAEALSDLNEAMSLDENNLFAMRDRAEVRFKTGDLDGAIEDFNKKLMLAPGDGRALCGRGEARLKQGDKEGALSDFQLAMRLSYPGAKELFNNAKGK